MTKLIFDQFSQIPDKAKRYRERNKVRKRCGRCGQHNSRWPKIHCKKCAKVVAEFCKSYQKKTRTPLHIRMLKLEHVIYELRSEINALKGISQVNGRTKESA